MTNQCLGVTKPLPTEAPYDDWVLPLSLADPSRVPPACVRWAERGLISCFFYGLLFDREILARWTNCIQRDSCDADLVLRAYERRGEAVLSRLRGSFVVAILDRARGTAIIARDPLGSHPLFYAEAGSCVLFATAPQLLVNQLGISRALNRAALADHLCNRWPDRHETFFADVRRVPPGWRALISGGRLRVERYWRPMPEGQRVEWLTAQETARFDEIFDRAVDRCLHNGPTGIFLSGGLDSISVAAIAADRARLNGQSAPWALSLGFPDPACNEQIRQAAVARHLGLRQHLVSFDEAVGSRGLLEQALGRNQEAPPLNPWQPAYLGLARRARLDGVRTILTGQGGDEWLAVTPYLSADLIRRGALLELAQFFGTLRRSYGLPLLAQVRYTFWTCGLRPLAGLALHRLLPNAHDANRLERLLAGDPSWVAPDHALRAEQRRRAEGCLTPSDPPEGFYMRDLWSSIDHTLISWESEEQHEMGKRIGVRFLHPFRDPDLIEMLCRTPPRVLNEGGRTKSLVRATLSRRFPGLGFERQRKVSARFFFESLLLRDGPGAAEMAGDFPALSELGVVDGRAVRDFIRGELNHASPRIQRIWEPIKLEMWVRSRSDNTIKFSCDGG
jgi:asparagine synthase (glutamine-hydrolysing)